MKINEIKGERALELLADMFEPMGRIMGDPVIKGLAQDKSASKIDMAKAIIKGHSKDTLEILALMDGVDIADGSAMAAYRDTATIPIILRGVLDILNDPDVVSLFTWQGQK